LNERREVRSIEVVPLEFARGRSFSDAVVICDEAQNTLILNGDIAQVDHRETPGRVGVRFTVISSQAETEWTGQC
jgi:predicted ribonuclease YlaK